MFFSRIYVNWVPSLSILLSANLKSVVQLQTELSKCWKQTERVFPLPPIRFAALDKHIDEQKLSAGKTKARGEKHKLAATYVGKHKQRPQSQWSKIKQNLVSRAVQKYLSDGFISFSIQWWCRQEVKSRFRFFSTLCLILVLLNSHRPTSHREFSYSLHDLCRQLISKLRRQ